MFGDLLTPMHMLFVLIIVLVIFGPKRLPDIGKSLGKGIKEFKKATTETQEKLTVGNPSADSSATVNVAAEASEKVKEPVKATELKSSSQS